MAKNIMIVLLNDMFGGAEQVTKQIVDYFLRSGDHVDLFFVTKSKGNFWDDYENRRGIQIFRTNAKNEKNGFVPLVLKFLKRRKKNYDMVFSTHIYLNSLLSILRKLNVIRTNRLVCRDSHAYYLVDKGNKLRLYNFLIKIGYGGQDLIISQTEEMKNQLLVNNKKNKRLPKIVHVLGNPIDLREIIINEDLSIPKKTIISAGRLIEIKGFDILLRSFSNLKNFKEYTLILLGEGVEENNLRKIAIDLGISENVKFLGFQKDVFSYFFHADVCVVSSIREGFPNVLLQMISQNNNVVSTLCADGIQNINGLITCESGSSQLLTKAIESAINNHDNIKNRPVFDEEISKRTIDGFMNKIFENLKPIK
ncbi:glycosyltransferase [Sphingobacterium sp. Mn56C]|uniref:glycosyltransferase n=1 Tax=Sphingobacterium sp. Mn56C TaxID=3395261 RepID=UPI003BCD3291